MIRSSTKSGRGVTLTEMLLTLGLVALAFTLLTTTLIQIARYVRDGRRVATERTQLLRTVEDLRYQLRSLYYPAESGAPGLSGMRGIESNRDTLRFLTAHGRRNRGVVEVGYRLANTELEDGTEGMALQFREFPFRRDELRSLDEQLEAPWALKLSAVDSFQVEYSTTGVEWQREWQEASPPRVVRIRIVRSPPSRDRFVFDVTPGIGAGRW